MITQETVIAERDVALDPRDTMNVRISEDAGEQFWRVEVRHAGTARSMTSTTVGGNDSFLWHLIQSAVDGDGRAWHQLAGWGHGVMTRSRVGRCASA